MAASGAQIFSGHIKYFQVEERDAQLASIRNSISVLNAEYMADLASVREECQELGRSVQVGCPALGVSYVIIFNKREFRTTNFIS